MAGFGYKEITYTLSSGAQRIDKYLAVTRGLEGFAGYLNISSNVTFSSAYSIEIYEWQLGVSYEFQAVYAGRDKKGR